MKSKVKIILFSFFVVLLLLPALQREFNVISFKPLNGAFSNTSRKQLTVNGFLNNKYQTAFEQNLIDSVGFKNFFVRLNNQLGYSLYSKSNAKKVVVGTEGVLYEDYYIKSYYGNDYVGFDFIDNKVKLFSQLQNKLALKGVKLFLVITPSKTAIYPNNFPRYMLSEKDTTNYEITVKLLDKYNCNYLDLKKYFVSIKNSKYPLFPKQGIHWSGYGITLAADTMFKYIQRNSNVKLNNIIIDEGSYTNEYMGTDNDIGDAQNLLFKSTYEKLYYPKLSFSNKLKEKPKVLVVGDSFVNGFWKFYAYFSNLFDESKSSFWYYNQTVIWPEIHEHTKVSDLNLYDEVVNKDIILVITSEQNLNNFGFFFIDNVLNIINDDCPEELSEVNFYINKIKSDSDWYNKIKEKAKTNNVSVKEQLKNDATWLVNNK